MADILQQNNLASEKFGLCPPETQIGHSYSEPDVTIPLDPNVALLTPVFRITRMPNPLSHHCRKRLSIFLDDEPIEFEGPSELLEENEKHERLESPKLLKVVEAKKQ